MEGQRPRDGRCLQETVGYATRKVERTPTSTIAVG
jgi:hypothetical protein